MIHHVYKDGKQRGQYSRKLIDSMPKRVARVIEVNGKTIGYLEK